MFPKLGHRKIISVKIFSEEILRNKFRKCYKRYESKEDLILGKVCCIKECVCTCVCMHTSHRREQEGMFIQAQNENFTSLVV